MTFAFGFACFVLGFTTCTLIIAIVQTGPDFLCPSCRRPVFRKTRTASGWDRSCRCGAGWGVEHR